MNPSSAALRSALAGMFAMAAAMGVGRFVYTPLLPLMIEAGALDAARAGYVAGANFVGYLLGALAASLAVFSARRHGWALAGLVLGAATSAAMAVTDDVMLMALIRFVSGVASAFAMIFTTSIVMVRFVEAARIGLTAVHFAGVGLGIAISAVMVSLMAAAGFGWQAIWLAAAGLGLAGTLADWFLLPAGPRRPAAFPAAHAPAPARFAQGLPILIVSYGLFGFGYVILATFINAMARAEPVLRPVEPWVWLVVGLAGMPSIWLWNRVAVRVGVARAYAAACAVEALGVALPLFVLSPAALILSAIGLGGTFMAITALGLTRAREMVVGDPSRAVALMTASFGLGQVIGPVVAGSMFDRLGDFVAASFLAAAVLVAAAVLAVLAEAAARRAA